MLNFSRYIKENYENRVKDFVKKMVGDEPMTIRDFEKRMETFGNPIERKVIPAHKGKSSTAWGDFKKDALSYAKKEKLIVRKKTPRASYYIEPDRGYEKIPVTRSDIMKLGYAMQDYAGNSFPDGDPHDHLYGYFKKRNWDKYVAFDKLVPAASKLVLKTKSYSDYLANLWDDQFSDAKGDYEHNMKLPEKKRNLFTISRMRSFGGPKARNPWK